MLQVARLIGTRLVMGEESYLHLNPISGVRCRGRDFAPARPFAPLSPPLLTSGIGRWHTSWSRQVHAHRRQYTSSRPAFKAESCF